MAVKTITDFGAGAAGGMPLGVGPQRGLFYGNGLWWLVYTNDAYGPYGVDSGCYYATSPDGDVTDWNITLLDYNANRAYKDSAYFANGILHYGTANSTNTGPGYYMLFQPDAFGNLTLIGSLSAPAVSMASYYSYYSVALDTLNYAWVAHAVHDGVRYHPAVTRSTQPIPAGLIPLGTEFGPDVSLDNSTLYSYCMNVLSLSNKNLLVVWGAYTDTGGSAVMANIFDGSTWGSAFTVAPTPASATSLTGISDKVNNFYVIWSEYGATGALYLRRYNRLSGWSLPHLMRGNITRANAGDEEFPRLSLTQDGKLVAVWAEQFRYIYASEIDVATLDAISPQLVLDYGSSVIQVIITPEYTDFKAVGIAFCTDGGRYVKFTKHEMTQQSILPISPTLENYPSTIRIGRWKNNRTALGVMN